MQHDQSDHRWRRGRAWRGLTPAGLGLLAALTSTSAHAVPTEPETLVNPLVETVACELCHGYSNPVADMDDPPYSPFQTWQGSLMANSARDPVFWAGVAVADADAPGETELCVRCHAPRAFLDGHGDVTAVDQLTLDEQSGVECELCHRAVEDIAVPPGNAMYTIDDVLEPGGTNVPRRGPWDYTDGVPEPPHDWMFDSYIGTSRMCGTCHDVTTEAERVDDDGVGLGVPFNEQRTYTEWLRSDFAMPGAGFSSCQDCHMPAIPDMPGCQAHVNQFTHATGGRSHDLVGANRFMVELLQAEYGSAGANQVADFFFDNTLAAMDAFVTSAATLEVVGPAEVDLEQGLPGIAVTVTNNTGHKLPTGYSEGRVMWIEVLADYAGQRVYSSGAWDQASGQIEQDAQLRTYEGIAERYADGLNFHLLFNDHWVVDSRIPPLGLTPDLETDPVGDRYALLPNGTWPNFDQHSYDFGPDMMVTDATPGDTTDDELVVTVRLQYVINTTEYVEFLANNAGPAGSHVDTLFDLAGGAPPVTLAEQTLTIPIIGFGAVSSTDSGGAPTTTDSGVADSTATTAGVTSLPGGTASDASGSTTGPGQLPGDEGCSCRTTGGAPAWWGLGLVLLWGRRRRRSALVSAA
ncbi:MAG: hypothetical protein K0V04_27755 [Deltaproteobacteria bacterium]|nr:hypothetical protein [Deltaproteobacteria bacterium]